MSRLGRIALSFIVLATLVTAGAPPPPPARAGNVGAEPDLAMAPLREFRIQWVGGRRLLRFTGMIVNIGSGPFHLRGSRASTAEPMRMSQVIYHGSDINSGVATQFVTQAVASYSGDGHNHWHTQEIARYDLWGGPNIERGEKIGFCFFDSDPYDFSLPGASHSRQFHGHGCSTDPNALSNSMGISVGWGDLYPWNFAWQWIDITGMPGGTYTVRAWADPYGFFAETNDNNQCQSVQVSWTDHSNDVQVGSQVPECWNDWGGSIFAGDIEWAFSAGITTGCSHYLYCTEQLVLREQMASFLARARNLPPTTTDYFWDDAGSWHQADINRAAEAGVTNGCGDGRYCPTNLVPRGQMATFLVRAFDLPPATRDYFSDDNGWWHEADINSLAEAGVTLGCGGSNFCPHDSVNRGQMAAFLHRAMTD